MENNKRLAVTAVIALLLFPPQSMAINDVEIDNSPCTFVNKGTIKSFAEIKLNCPTLPPEAIQNLEKLIQEHLKEQTRNLRQKNDHIDLLSDQNSVLKDQIARIQQERDRALAENKQDQQNNPDSPLLAEEQKALEAYDLRKAAELREEYYQGLKKEKQARIREMQTEMAREAFVSAERWESAFNSERALELYQEAVGFKPDYPEAWRQITLVAEKLGKTQLALEATRSLQKQLDPKRDKKWFSIALSDEADLLTSLGENRSAFDLYQKLLQHITKLVETEPENTEWQRDLSVSYDRVGDMHKANGDGIKALKAYEESLAIRKTLAELDPKHTEWQRDLSVSHNKVGDMHQANGDEGAALKAYEESLDIWEKLKKLDPKNADWQRGSTIPLERIGDMHKANGDGIKALKAYEDGLAIAKTLAELDPKHTGWQRDLSVSYDKIGNMHQANGDGIKALKAYEDGLAIAKTLAELNPKMVQWQTDLVVSYYKLSQLKPDESKMLLGDALAILKRLDNEGRLEVEKQAWIPTLEGLIGQ